VIWESAIAVVAMFWRNGAQLQPRKVGGRKAPGTSYEEKDSSDEAAWPSPVLPQAWFNLVASASFDGCEILLV